MAAPFYPTITNTNFCFGDYAHIRTNRPSSDYLCDLTYALYDVSHNLLATGIVASKVGDAYDCYVPKDLMNKIPNSRYALFEITSWIYQNGNFVAEGGTASLISIPTSTYPTCKIVVSDAMGYASKYGGYVQGKSKAKVTITPTTYYGATVKSYSTSANGQTISGNPATTSALLTSGTNTIKTTITDSRAKTGSASTTINVLEYESPSASVSVMRCDKDGNELITGDYFKATITYNIYPLGNVNNKSCQLYYNAGTLDPDTMETVDITLDDYSGTVSQVVPASSDHTYSILVLVTDDLSAASVSTSVSSGFALMHWRNTGLGMAIGRVCESDAFEIGMPTKIIGDGTIPLIINSGAQEKAISITSSYGWPKISIKSTADSNTVALANFYTNSSGTVILESRPDGTASNRCYLTINKKDTALSNRLKLYDVTNGTSKTYQIYHAGNKPPISTSQLWSGSWWSTTEGNFGGSSWGYSGYVLVGLTSGNSYITMYIPANHILTTNRTFCIADDAGYMKFYLRYTGTTLYVTGVTRTSGYTLRFLYGIK